jgi:hypothetical protein
VEVYDKQLRGDDRRITEEMKKRAIALTKKRDDGPTSPVSIRFGKKLLAKLDDAGAKLGYKDGDRAELVRDVVRKFVGEK